MKTVVITGVTGQDGSYMVEFLLANTNHKIVGVVRHSTKPHLAYLNQSLKNERFSLETADLADSHSINRVVKKHTPDYFINLAAQSFVGSSWDSPEHTFDIDAVGVLRCLEAVRHYAPECRFYNAGSSEEYGDVQFSPQNENHPYRARSPYGAAKISARQIVKVYRESYNLYALQGLLFNHESPRRGDLFVTRKITKQVAQIKDALDKGQQPQPVVLGNLESSRDWSHAEDMVRGIWMMMNQEVCNPTFKGENRDLQEYVFASGRTHTIREFIELSFKTAGIDIKDTNPQRLEPIQDDKAEQVNYIGNGQALVTVSTKFFRPAEVNLLLGDPSRAKHELGWRPLHTFEGLVTEMVKSDIALTKGV